MLVFMDESGDAGLKGKPGSSRYFVLVLVVFEDSVQAARVDAGVNALRAQHRLDPKYEFHFNRMSRERRLDFLRTVASFRFQYYAIVIDKRSRLGLVPPGKNALFRYASQRVFEMARSALRGATVVIDGAGDREFKREMESYLKTCINEENEVIRKVKVQNSRDNNLLQLADMVAGAVARSYSPKEDAQEYRNVIRSREADVQLWPPLNA